MNNNLKKNILDLHFQKYLIVSSTSIIIVFTYLIGVYIAIITKQVNLNDIFPILILITISIAVIGTCSVFFFKSQFHIKRILELIKDLE